METYDDGNHADGAFATHEESRAHQDDDRYGNRGQGQRELDVLTIGDYHDELDGESQEEEKVKLQQCNVDLTLR